MSRLIPVLGIVLLAVGCASQQTRTTSPDPFFGELPAAPPVVGKPAPVAKEFTGKPEEPPTTNTTSTAEITNNGGVKLGNPRPAETKAKTDGGPAPLPGIGAPEDSAVSTKGPPAPAREPAVTTKNSIALAPTPGGLATVANQEPAPTPPPSYEALQKRLQERGVTWQQLQHVGKDRWHFICAIVDPDSPGYRENFEVTREGNMGLNAIQAVLDQIEKRAQTSPSPQAIRGGTRSDG